MDDLEKWRAVAANDRSYDGKFYYGVKSTGIYCRPSCASKLPRRENVLFFDRREAAESMGFRPCKRCRPDLIAYAPAEELAAEAKTIMERSYAEGAALQSGLNALGVTRRHLTELFERAYGLAPEQYIARLRLEQAKELLAAGRRITDVAFAVGMESAASFSVFFKKQTGIAPSEYAAQRRAEHPFCFCATPLGMVRIEEDEDGLTSLQFAPGEASPAPAGGVYLAEAGAQLSEYFAGRRRSFDIPLSVQGSEFQKRVWSALREIPYGETRSYQQIAAAVGNEKASRAVGMANNRNPILILIPCHRVIGKDGRPVGYAGGIDRKLALLEMEAAR